MARKTISFILTLFLLTQAFLFTAFGTTASQGGIPAIDIAALMAYAINSSHYMVAGIPSGSMANTVPQGAIIVVDRNYYEDNALTRQDVVLFVLPDTENSYGLKRVLGLPGETIEIVDGRVYINGEMEPVDEPYLMDSLKLEGNYGPYEIPENAYFILGDNRAASYDSRYWDDPFIYGKFIAGKAVYIYQP